MTTQSHTPTPWTWDAAFRILRGKNGGEVGYSLPFTKEDAAFIVRAVNSYEQLLKGCRMALGYLRDDCKKNSAITDFLEAAIAKGEQ